MESAVILPPDYRPSADEEYMNEMQLEYFRQKLLNWKKSLIGQSKDTLDDLRQGGLNQPDQIDRASLESDKALELRTRDRARKLISKIDEALKRIEDGVYGYSYDKVPYSSEGGRRFAGRSRACPVIPG